MQRRKEDVFWRPVHVRQRSLHPAHLPVRRRQRLRGQQRRERGAAVQQSTMRPRDRVRVHTE